MKSSELCCSAYVMIGTQEFAEHIEIEGDFYLDPTQRMLYFECER